MIKLGDAYFDEASIVAIQPCDAYGAEGPAMSYLVHLVGGGFYQWAANAAEVQRRLEKVGLVEPEVQLASLEFSSNEMELLMDALKQGYYYVARDSTGQIYAYRDLPQKGAKCWSAAADIGPQTLRLHGEFAALSWDDESPLIIETALEGMQRC